MSYDCWCAYDLPDFYHSSTRKARKAHHCDECGNLILPRDKYNHAVSIYDGIFSSYKTCGKCIDLATWVKNNIPCLCWAHGNMLEDCHEAVEEACYRAPEETKGLYFGFLKRKVLNERFYSQRKKLQEPAQDQVTAPL